MEPFIIKYWTALKTSSGGLNIDDVIKSPRGVVPQDPGDIIFTSASGVVRAPWMIRWNVALYCSISMLTQFLAKLETALLSRRKLRVKRVNKNFLHHTHLEDHVHDWHRLHSFMRNRRDYRVITLSMRIFTNPPASSFRYSRLIESIFSLVRGEGGKVCVSLIRGNWQVTWIEWSLFWGVWASEKAQCGFRITHFVSVIAIKQNILLPGWQSCLARSAV